MSIYLPIAEMNVNMLLIVLLGIMVGGLTGLFGVGGGFLMTPTIEPAIPPHRRKIPILISTFFFLQCAIAPENDEANI